MNRSMKILTPATDWREGLPCGDGSFCALVYGGISPETILFNHDRLWYGGKVVPLPDLSAELKNVREMGLQGNLQDANDHLSNLLKSKGVQGQVPIFHPGFDLKIKAEQTSAFKNYRRTLDFSTGEATVAWEDGDKACERRFFISRTRHIGVLKITAGNHPVETAFQLCEHNLSDSFGMDGIPKTPPLEFETRSEDDKLFLTVKGSDGGDYGAVMKIIPDEGSLTAYEDVTWAEQTSSLPLLWGLPLPRRSCIKVAGAKSVTALIGYYVNTRDSQKAQESLCRQLDALAGDYDLLFSEHKQLHSEIYNRLCLDICDDAGQQDVESNDILLLKAYQGQAPAELLVKLFDYGRYLLLCCSNEDGLPPTLQGTYNGDYFPAWNSFYVHNENTQMYYWQALSGRMPEVTGAMFGYFENFIEDYKENARKLFGCRGIFIPLVAAANTGLLQDPQPHVIHFTGCAAWIAAHFYDYYLYTGDLEFLKNRAIPFMEQVALFYEDYLMLDEDGRYTVFPSNSPENSPANSFPEDVDLTSVMNPGIPTTFNSTIDTALVKELLTNLSTAYRLLNIRPEKAELYEGMTAKLRPYRINEDGALAEWISEKHTDNYAHRHLSHLYPLFPGFEITESDKALFDAAKVAVDKRIQIGLSSQTGWSLVHLANIYARLHRGEQALECLDILTRTCVGRNLFTYHNDYRNMGVTLKVILGKSAPYQIDANMGLTSAIIEMLLYSDTRTLRITPALPKKWIKGKIGTLAARCGCEADISWDQNAHEITVTLTAKDTRVIRIVLPEGYESDGLNAFDLSVQKGQSYTIRAHLPSARRTPGDSRY